MGKKAKILCVIKVIDSIFFFFFLLGVTINNINFPS